MPHNKERSSFCPAEGGKESQQRQPVESVAKLEEGCDHPLTHILSSVSLLHVLLFERQKEALGQKWVGFLFLLLLSISCACGQGRFHEGR